MELLELFLSPLDDMRFLVIVTQSPAGEGHTESSLPFRDADRDWRATVIRSLEAARFDPMYFSAAEREWMVAAGILAPDRPSFHHNYLANIGEALYQALFPPDSAVKRCLTNSIHQAHSVASQLLVRLKFPEIVGNRSPLADYPWELLHDGRFLCHHQVEFSRYIAYGAAPPNLPTASKLNVLLVSSAASDRGLNLNRLSDEEKEAVRQGLEVARERGDIVLEELEKPTFANLRTYLAEHTAPQVLHFDGHGVFGKRCPNERCGTMNLEMDARRCRTCDTQLLPPQGYLAFEDENGNANYISAEELGTLLQKSGLSDGNGQTRGLVLVVLSACQSGMVITGESVFNGAAQNLIFHRVPAVVAMQYSVMVDSATKFVEQFYRSLGQKNSLAVAVSQARSAMGVDGNQWYRPVLYLRWQDNEGGKLFAEATSPQTVPENQQHEEFLQDFGQSLFSERVDGDAQAYRCFLRLRFHPQNYPLPTKNNQDGQDIAALMQGAGFPQGDILETERIVIAEIVRRYEAEIKGDKKDSQSWINVQPGQAGIWQQVYQWLWDCKFARWQLDRQFWELLKEKVDVLDWIKIGPEREKNWELLQLPEAEPLRVGEPLWISIQLPPAYRYLLLLNRGLNMRCFLCPSYIFAPEYQVAENLMILPQRESFWYQQKKSGMRLTMPGTEEDIAIALKEALDFDWLNPTRKELVLNWTSDRLSQLWQWLKDNPNSWQGCYQEFKVVE